jgi:xanthine dehydrogenase accessory factor
MRGHNLGRVIFEGTAATNTGVPGEIGGYTMERLITAPKAGKFMAVKKIGDVVKAGEILCYVDEAPVCGAIDGILRGILHDGLLVAENMKIGDIDPRTQGVNCWSISDKARAIGGGVLEALLMSESCFQVPSV